MTEMLDTLPETKILDGSMQLFNCQLWTIKKMEE